MSKLSVVLATYNEEKNIQPCLDSVRDFANEIIVVDGSSSDKTVPIARKLGAKVYVVPNQTMFHKNKQLALDKAQYNWILQLDADERVTEKLKKEILLTIRQPADKQPTVNAYYIPRKNYFLGRFLTKGGQYPDYVIRLVRKGKAYFPCRSVHEQIAVNGSIGYLKNDLMHLGHTSFSHYLRNANRYTTLTAQELYKKNISINFISKVNFLFWLPTKTFLMIYIRHKGFMDGFPGFVFALFSGLHHAIAFIKYWQKKRLKASFNFKDWE
jgi:glycosyltransferase involved in cell wall biosynthesis